MNNEPKRPMTDEERARVQAIVDKACADLQRETARIIDEAVTQHRTDERTDYIASVIVSGALSVVALLLLFGLALLVRWIAGAL